MTMVLTTGLYSSISSQSIRDLDFLIGSWNVREVVYADTPKEYIETGKRECLFYLDSAYIKCETKAIRKGKNREYTFLYNYVKETDEFRLFKFSSDFDAYGIKSWKINQEAKVIEEEDKTGYQFIGASSFVDKNRIIWKGWAPKIGQDPELELIYTEEAIRK
jgi:hypothetical protein